MTNISQDAQSESGGDELSAARYSLMVPDRWQRLALDKKAEQELLRQLDSKLGAGVSASERRKLRATILATFRDMRSAGVTDVYIPKAMGDEKVPLPVSLTVLPVATGGGSVEDVARRMDATGELETTETSSGKHCLWVEYGVRDAPGIEPTPQMHVFSVVNVPGSTPPTALLFNLSVLEPEILGEKLVEELQMAFLTMLHTLRWEFS